jgi:hypothetical protein
MVFLGGPVVGKVNNVYGARCEAYGALWLISCGIGTVLSVVDLMSTSMSTKYDLSRWRKEPTRQLELV